MKSKLSVRMKSLGKIIYRLFTYALVILCTAVVIIGMREERTTFFGYSFFYIMSHSMDPVYPKDSLIAIKEADPDQIQIGDDITFLETGNKLVTHRVIEIFENYEESGMRGFETKGVNNSYIDEDIVYGGNVLGVVVYSVTWIGSVLGYIRQNVWLCCSLGGVLIIFLYLIKRLLTRQEKTDEATKQN